MPSSISRLIDCLVNWKCRARLKSDCCRNACQCDIVEGDTKLSHQNSNEITPNGVSKKTQISVI